MLKIRLYLIVAVCAALVGCSSDKPADNQGSGKTDPKQASNDVGAGKEEKPDLSTAAPVDQGDKGESKPSKEIAIPASLKSQAFDYFGINQYSKFNYEVASSDGSSNELTRELKLLSANDKELVVEESASSIGGVQKFEHVLKKDGLYSRQVRADGTKGQLQLALPSELVAGKKWQTKTTVEVVGKSIEMNSSSTIVGFEKIKVGDKTYDALKLREDATLGGSSPEKWKTTTWLAKGVGLVKMEIDRTPKGQPSVKSTMTLK